MSVLPESYTWPESYAHGGPWTEADYFALPEDNARVELLDGALLLNPPPTTGHQRLAGRLTSRLDRSCPTGMEALCAIGIRVGPSRVLIPDIAVVSGSGSDVKSIDSPDVLLALEIVSPGSIATDRAIKPLLYAEAGIPVYVRVERAGPTAHVYGLIDGRYVLQSSGSTLRLEYPFPIEVDLVALIEADRTD